MRFWRFASVFQTTKYFFSASVLVFSHVEVYVKYKINTEKYMATLIKAGGHIVFIFSEHEKRPLYMLSKLI